MNRILACLSVLGMSTPGWGECSDWELVFNDEFSAASFDGKKLDWDDGNWNKINYVNWTVADWRKYQSRDDSLVTSGQSNGIDYVTLKGAYGDYTSQNDQSGASNTFACGGIFTDKTFSFRYGYVEVRARFESEQGVWPAIWLLPKSGGWPDAGEIDIMEHINSQNQIWQTLHMLNNAGTGDVAPSEQTQITQVNDWHTYGMEWTEDLISFYIDGQCTATFYASDYKNWPFDDGREFYLLIDQQIGGSWTGEANANTLSKNSANFDVDYVRVYSTQKNSLSAAACPAWGENGPIETDGTLIRYNGVTNVTSGALEQVNAGNYSYTVNDELGRILAEDSNIRLATQNGGDTVKLSGDMVQARSLYVADGKYIISSADIDTDTLYVVGGSLEVGSANALNSVEQLYLGMETDAITQSAQRNAALYITSDQHVMGDVTLVDDSKIAVAFGNTLKISGDVHAEGHTLNLVGVTSTGAGVVELCGADNRIGNMWLGVAGTTEAGNTFNGGGQILKLTLAEGSKTTVAGLVTNTPNEYGASSLTIEGGAALTVTKEWKNATSNLTYELNISQKGVFNIGNGTDAAKATSLAGVRITNKGLLYVQKGAEMNVESITVSSAGNETGNRAVLKVDGGLTASSIFLDGNKWHAIGTLDVLNGDDVHISTITTGTNGQVDINVRSGHLSLQTITPGNTNALVLQAESYALGSITVQNTVTNTNEIEVRAGRVEFSGGLAGGGLLDIVGNAVVSVFGSAGNQRINVSQHAVLEIDSSYSGGTVSGSGTIRKTDDGTATVTTATNFSGSVHSERGSIQLGGLASYTALAATGGDLQVSHDAAITTQSIQVEKGNTLKVLEPNSRIGTLKLAAGGVLEVGSGILVANLWCGEGVTLNTAVNGGLTVEGSLTLAGHVTLGQDLVNALVMDNVDSFTLVRGVTSFTVGDSVWEMGQSVAADAVFNATGIDLSEYTLSYVPPVTRSNMGGMLILTRSIPEPTTAALSLLGILAFATRRRRH